MLNKLKSYIKRKRCGHKLVRPTNLARPFNAGFIRGQLPVFQCINCEELVHQPLK